MDHPEATRIGAVERYLLEEMSARERGDFEEHFFDCPQCAADVKATAGFLDAARRELKRDAFGEHLAGGREPPQASKSPLARTWRPAFAGWAATLLLCVVIYQNAVMFPRLSPRPSTPATLFLVGGNTRGGTIPSVTVSKLNPLLLSVDIPTADAYAGYSCVLVAQSGATVWSLPVTAEQARDTVPIVVPTTGLSRGDYTLVVRGHAKEGGGPSATDLAHYRFTVNSSN
jgi:anti-sigma factor RsiW